LLLGLLERVFASPQLGSTLLYYVCSSAFSLSQPFLFFARLLSLSLLSMVPFGTKVLSLDTQKQWWSLFSLFENLNVSLFSEIERVPIYISSLLVSKYISVPTNIFPNRGPRSESTFLYSRVLYCRCLIEILEYWYTEV